MSHAGSQDVTSPPRTSSEPGPGSNAGSADYIPTDTTRSSSGRAPESAEEVLKKAFDHYRAGSYEGARTGALLAQALVMVYPDQEILGEPSRPLQASEGALLEIIRSMGQTIVEVEGVLLRARADSRAPRHPAILEALRLIGEAEHGNKVADILTMIEGLS